MLEVSAAPAQDAAIDEAVEAARELGVEEEAVPLTSDEVRARCASHASGAASSSATAQPSSRRGSSGRCARPRWMRA